MSDEEGVRWANWSSQALGLYYARLSDIKVQKSEYAKILPMDEDERREFIYNATVTRNIYSLGRFATWRPHLLLDDLVKDIRTIEGFLRGGKQHYEMKLAR
jgi:hypothetical protein